MSAVETYMPRLKQRYNDELRSELQEGLGLKSIMQVPRITKVTLNMGVGEAKTEAKLLDAAIEELSIIAGQRAQVRRAKKSVAQFKIREGMPIGARVTLRGDRMWDFIDRLISIALPRIRDFRGLNPTSFDGRGNYSLGLREQIIFPEIDYDKVDQVRGLDVTITTTAKTDAEAFALLQAFGMPFTRDGRGPGEDAAHAEGSEADIAQKAAAEVEAAPEPEAAVEESSAQAEDDLASPDGELPSQEAGQDDPPSTSEQEA